MTIKKKRTIIVACAIALGIFLPILAAWFMLEAAYCEGGVKGANPLLDTACTVFYVVCYFGCVTVKTLPAVIGERTILLIAFVVHFFSYGLAGWIIARIFIRPSKPISANSDN